MDTPNIDHAIAHILPTNTKLTYHELDILMKAAQESEKIIDSCRSNDDDVLNWHERFLEKAIKRMELSIKLKSGDLKCV